MLLRALSLIFTRFFSGLLYGTALRQLGQPVPPDGAEEAHRVAVGGLPQLVVHGPEDVLRLGVPGPAQVDREVGQRGQRLGQDGTDGESSDRSHPKTVAQLLWIDPIAVSTGR